MPNESILIAFSNPADSHRLRLDREQRALRELLAPDDFKSIRFLTAATVDDLAEALSVGNLRVVHFSGHGSETGFYFESSGEGESGQELSAEALAELISQHCPNLQALILASCYSASSCQALRGVATYVVTVEGPADDTAAIAFARNFYSLYFRRRPIEAAVDATKATLQANGIADGFRIFVSRRSDVTGANRTLLAATTDVLKKETIFIDITDIEEDISRLPIARDDFFSLLSDRVRIHRWMTFDSVDMECAVLPIGPFFGLFSWQCGMDYIRCRRIIHLKPDASTEACDLWMRLSFKYNQLFALSIRQTIDVVPAGMSRKVEYAVERFQSLIRYIQGTNVAGQLRELVPDQARVALPLMDEHFSQAVENASRDELSNAIIHMETTLSFLHSILDALMGVLCVPPSLNDGLTKR
jgi:hypothetical protein